MNSLKSLLFGLFLLLTNGLGLWFFRADFSALFTNPISIDAAQLSRISDPSELPRARVQFVCDDAIDTGYRIESVNTTTHERSVESVFLAAPVGKRILLIEVPRDHGPGEHRFVGMLTWRSSEMDQLFNRETSTQKVHDIFEESRKTVDDILKNASAIESTLTDFKHVPRPNGAKFASNEGAPQIASEDAAKAPEKAIQPKAKAEVAVRPQEPAARGPVIRDLALPVVLDTTWSSATVGAGFAAALLMAIVGLWSIVRAVR